MLCTPESCLSPFNCYNRPVFEVERQISKRTVVKTYPRDRTLLFIGTVGTRMYEEEHRFDGVFDHSASQQNVYSVTASTLVPDVCDGLNCAVLAFGQTGTGTAMLVLVFLY